MRHSMKAGTRTWSCRLSALPSFWQLLKVGAGLKACKGYTYAVLPKDLRFSSQPCRAVNLKGCMRCREVPKQVVDTIALELPFPGSPPSPLAGPDTEVLHPPPSPHFPGF